MTQAQAEMTASPVPLSREELLKMYDYVGSFKERVVLVRQGKKYFHVDLAGIHLYENSFDSVGDFCEETAPAKEYGKWFHIDRNGEPLYEARFDDVGDFHNGITWAKKGVKIFQINLKGKQVPTPRKNRS